MPRVLPLLAFGAVTSHALAPPPSAVARACPSRQRGAPPTSAQEAVGAAGSCSCSCSGPFGAMHQHHTSRRVDRDILVMVRGGDAAEDVADDTESDGESDEYDTSDDETLAESEEASSDGDEAPIDDSEEEEANQPSPEKIERLQKSVQLSSQSRNFGIATALWASLFFDTLLNTKKRADLFPTNLASKLIPTATLASGFGMAAGTAFLMWRDMEVRADMLASDEGESPKGDTALSLASGMDGSEKAEAFASITRARLCLHLAVFGLLNLGAHAGYYFSSQAPFLGTSAAVINGHNLLAAVSALRKEEGTKNVMMQILTWPIRAFRGGEGKGRLSVASFLYRLSMVMACVNCIPVCKNILSLGSGLLSGAAGATESIVSNNARQLSLQIASVARLTLAAGVSHTLYASSVGRNDKFRGHPFFAVLGGLLASSCLGVGGTMVLDSVQSVGLAPSNYALKGLLLVAFGILAGYHSVIDSIKA
ncbi:hypothetical protein ACHAXT_001749 [Thalassiosira profunda]